MNIPAEIRRWVVLGVIVAVLCFALAFLTMCQRGDVSRDRAQTANATGKALDDVARETPVIRADQEEKQREVDAIPGSNDRLPDGYGADLQRLRDRKRGDSRQP